MVDQPFKGFAGFDHVVQFKAGVAGVVAALGVAPPLAIFQRREVVKGCVEFSEQFRFDGIFQDQIAA